MEAAVNTITETLSPTALWGQVSTIMPFAAAITLFAFGFYLVRKIMGKAKKGKGGI